MRWQDMIGGIRGHACVGKISLVELGSQWDGFIFVYKTFEKLHEDNCVVLDFLGS